MNIDPTGGIPLNQLRSERSSDLQKEKAATDFEEIFARHLVKELTKDSFKMSGGSGMMGNSNNMYREFITDALASELAQQRRLGMADLVSRYWDNSAASKEQ
jgi:Rod binding domain-containing protein